MNNWLLYTDAIGMVQIKRILYEIMLKLENKHYRQEYGLKVRVQQQCRRLADGRTEVRVYRIRNNTEYAMRICINPVYLRYNRCTAITEYYKGKRYEFATNVLNKPLFDDYETIAADINKYFSSQCDRFEDVTPNFIEHYKDFAFTNELMNHPNDYCVRMLSLNFGNDEVAYNYLGKPFVPANKEYYWNLPDATYLDKHYMRYSPLCDKWLIVTPIKVFRDLNLNISDIIRTSEFLGVYGPKKYYDFHNYTENKYKMLTSLSTFLNRIIDTYDEFNKLKHGL